MVLFFPDGTPHRVEDPGCGDTLVSLAPFCFARAEANPGSLKGSCVFWGQYSTPLLIHGAILARNSEFFRQRNCTIHLAFVGPGAGI